MPLSEPKKKLVLHIEVPGLWADDLDENAAIYAGADDDPTAEVKPEHRLDVVLEEWMRETVGLTIVTIPGEKCLNSDFEVHAFTGRIVGAEARDI